MSQFVIFHLDVSAFNYLQRLKKWANPCNEVLVLFNFSKKVYVLPVFSVKFVCKSKSESFRELFDEIVPLFISLSSLEGDERIKFLVKIISYVVLIFYPLESLKSLSISCYFRIRVLYD